MGRRSWYASEHLELRAVHHLEPAVLRIGRQALVPEQQATLIIVGHDLPGGLSDHLADQGFPAAAVKLNTCLSLIIEQPCDATVQQIAGADRARMLPAEQDVF